MPHKQNMVIHFNPSIIGVLMYGNELRLQGFSAAAVLTVLGSDGSGILHKWC